MSPLRRLAPCIAAIVLVACRDAPSPASDSRAPRSATTAVATPPDDADVAPATNPPAVPKQAAERIGSRRVLLEPFDTLWHRGGTVDDSLLMYPYSIQANDSLVYVFDRGAMRLVAFDARSGAPRWTYGRKGGGPGEFGNAVNLALGADGGLRFLDRGNSRFMEIGPDGQLVREWPFRLNTPVLHSCTLGDGTMLLAADRSEPFGVLHLDAGGELLRRLPLPWPDLDTVPGLARQAFFAPVGNGRECIFAFFLGRGFARLSTEGAAWTARYVEDFELAAVVTRRFANGGINMRVPDDVVYATRSPSVDGDTLVTLFMGPRGRYHERFLDHYDVATGAYVYSRLLPTASYLVERVNGTYFVLSLDGDFPSLTALRVRGDRSPRPGVRRPASP